MTLPRTMPPRRACSSPSDGRGCRRQVRDLVFLILILQICRADGARGCSVRPVAESCRAIGSTLHRFAMDDWGEYARLACSFGRHARNLVGQISWLTGFRRDAENGNRDGCAPFLTDFVWDGWSPCASTQPPCVWLISGCPDGTNAAAKIILRWTFGAFGV
jgi:hypothetical protein